MRRIGDWLVAFGRFWWDFVVGDDWTIAAGVIAALAVTYGLVHGDARPAWWLLPLGSVTLVAVGVRRADRREQEAAPSAEERSRDSAESPGS